MKSLFSAILMSIIVPCITSISYADEEKLNVGDIAPPISLFKIESNKYFRSKELLGKKNLVVSFFATWCVPCEKEIPELTKLSKQFSDGFEFVLINTDKEKRAKVKEYISDKNITLQVIWDKYGKAFEKFDGSSLPLLVVINTNGKITYYKKGYRDGDENKLKEHLRTL